MNESAYIIKDVKTIITPWLISAVKNNSCYLITGASGFMARYIIETLMHLNEKHNKNITIYALARNEAQFWAKYSHYQNNQNFTLIHSDVSQLSTSLNKIKFTHIIHAASKASPLFYGKDPIGTYMANTLGTHQLLALADAVKVEKFLYISSSEVYGLTTSSHTSEEDFGFIDPTQVRSCYAESKKMGENMCISWLHQHKVPVVITRPFHTYGPGMDLSDGRVYADFVKNIINKDAITLNSDGLAERAFCYLTDAIHGIFTVLYAGEVGEAYNLGNPNEIYSIKQLAELLQTLYPDRCRKVSFQEGKISNGYIKSTVSHISPNIEKIQQIGWEPKISVAEGFKRTIESYLNDDC